MSGKIPGFCIHGPMGSGKSMLRSELARALSDTGLRVSVVSADKARRNLLHSPGNLAVRSRIRGEMLRREPSGGPFSPHERESLALALSTREGVLAFSSIAWGSILPSILSFCAENPADVFVAEWTRGHEDGLAGLFSKSIHVSCSEAVFVERARMAGWDVKASLARRLASGGDPYPGAILVVNDSDDPCSESIRAVARLIAGDMTKREKP